MDDQLPLLEMWYLALREPIGISVATNNADRMRQKLYQVRKAANDPALAALMLHTSPRNPSGEIIITHREVADFDPKDLPNV
jgi:hypothetical protein